MRYRSLARFIAATLVAGIAAYYTSRRIEASETNARDPNGSMPVILPQKYGVQVGNIIVKAPQITFDETRKALACTGETSIETDGIMIRVRDALIVVGGRKVFILSDSFIDLAPSKKPPNKAPEPTPTSVTSPAAQEPRQP